MAKEIAEALTLISIRVSVYFLSNPSKETLVCPDLLLMTFHMERLPYDPRIL